MNRETARGKAQQLVAKMTLEEKASQLSFDSPEIPRLNIPAYNWWGEGLHGVARAGTATMFPQAIGMAASFDTALLQEVGSVVAEEGRAKYNENSARGDRDIYKGLTFWSPNINIFRDPRWGRGQETYGEDPYLTTRLGVAFTKGLQGEGEVMISAACAKHYAVHSGPEALRHQFDAQASPKDMAETYLPAFEALVKEAKVEAVMGAYNRVNGEPCCGSNWLMQDILRDKWGFEGHYVSDAWALRDFFGGHGVSKTGEEAAQLALGAGCDLNCGDTYEKFLMNAYEAGLVTEAQITTAAERLFTTRYMLGLLDGSVYDSIPYTVVECKEHLALSEKAAAESIVLLKNDGVLPLDKEKLKTIGVIGPNANSRRALIGNYHGTASEYITVLDGIRRVAGEGVRILYSQGSALAEDRVEQLAGPGDRLAEAATVAQHSDVVVLCLGLNETLEGEEGDTGNSYASGDKLDLLLPKPQQDLMETVAAVGKPVILCLMTGSAMDLQFADANLSAVLQLWYPGARGGLSTAQMLFGEQSPSGKLPVSFYRSVEELPEFTDYSMQGRTYRYMTGEPLYPFGYGLTYGDLQLENVTAESLETGDVQLKVQISHQAGSATEDVLQVYVQVKDSSFAPPHPALCGFLRVSLCPGESKEYHVLVPASAFTVVNHAGERIYDGSDYLLHVGFNQPDARSKDLTGKTPLTIEVQPKQIELTQIII